jgi:hypothetical protein
MKKLKLDLDALVVESFPTGGGVEGRNSGALCVEGDESWDGNCGGYDTGFTCANTCPAGCTMYGTCHGDTCDPTRCKPTTCDPTSIYRTVPCFTCDVSGYLPCP